MLVWTPLWSTLDLGQIYVPLLALAVFGFVYVDRRPLIAGVCIGLLMAVKPQFAIWVVMLLAARHWSPALTAALSAAIASALPLAFGHADWYASWIETSASLQMLVYSDNLSLPSVLSRAHLSTAVALTATATWLVVLGIMVWVRRWPARRASSVALVASVLAGPISWVGYSLLLAPIFVSRGMHSDRMILAGMLLSVPGVLLWWSHAGFLIYDVALALCLWAVLVERRDNTMSRVPVAHDRVPERLF
jgi:alpha-1,2-mannosyltransferase/arabinofuranan 3-O-arabinosyltransferase